MAPRCPRAATKKKKQQRAYCLLWGKANGTRFYGVCTSSDPRSGHWPQLTNITFFFEGPHQKALQLETPEKKYVVSLANQMVLFIVRAITQFMSVQNLWRAVIVQNLEFSGSHEMKIKLSFSGTIRFLLQRTISSLWLCGSNSSWDQSTNIGRMVYCCDWLEKQYSIATDRFQKNDIFCLIWTYFVLINQLQVLLTGVWILQHTPDIAQ